MSRAVREVFVRLYEEGLIYRGKRLINWCPRCHTALSDLEVKYETVGFEAVSHRYPLKGAGREAAFVEVATTRPETMLGDTAVAVHPDDERYTQYKGEAVILPLVGARLPFIQDDAVDPKFGTGVVKVTPAHDLGGLRYGPTAQSAQISVIDEDAKITAAGGAYQGLDRFEARKRIVADLEAQGLLVKVESLMHNVGHCQRCETVVEPLLSTAMVCAASSPWRNPQSPRSSRDERSSFRPTGPIPTSSGCATSATGASPASCGGDTAFRHGIATTAATSLCRDSRS